jgi:phage terminase large subunit-like protein
MCLSHTIGPNQKPNGQIIGGAGNRTQAKKAFDEAAAIIKADPRFLAACKIRPSKNLIQHVRSGSAYTTVSADGDMQHGATPTMALLDELHVHRNRSLYEAMDTGLNKEADTLMVMITTAGSRTDGVAYEQYQYARQVALGEIDDPHFLPILFEDDGTREWDDEELWHEVNPGLKDGFPDLYGLRRKAKKAKHLPAEREAFEAYHLNRWQDGSLGGWIEMAVYDEGAEPPIDPDAFVGEECVIGVDLSSSFDMTAVVAAFRMDGGVAVLPRFFLPEETIQKRILETELPWREWVDDGHLIALPGAVIDEDVVEDYIRGLCHTYQVTEIACDPHRAARMMARLLDDGEPVVQFPQRRLTMHPAIDGLQGQILARTLFHGGHPVLRWNVQNATVSADYAGNLMFHKNKGKRGSIDGCVAMAMAVHRLSAEPAISIYDTDQRPDGLLFL